MNTAAQQQNRSVGLAWFKSSYSGSEGGDCVEVAHNWRKSSYSSDEGGNCVEVAAQSAAIHLRDSKNTGGATLTVSHAAWASFIGRVVG